MAQSLGIRGINLLLLPRQSSHAVPIYGSSSTISVNNNRQSQCRTFSQTNPISAKGGMMSAENFAPKMPPQQSMLARMRDIDPEQIPTDFGVLPGTFIKPEGKDMPSFFKQPKERLRFEWVWLKSWFTSVTATIVFHKWQSKPRLPLLLKERREIGKGLHTLMYEEFAKGNERMIRSKCSPGLANDLARRIRRRSPTEVVNWRLEKYNRDPSTFFMGARVLSDRATTIPDLPDSYIRQIVLRIKSQQSTFKMSKDETEELSKKGVVEIPLSVTSPKIQDCTEYLVIQKVRIGGRDRDWEIWGFVKPTTWEDLDSPFFASGLTLKERVQAMQDKIYGRM